MSKQGTVEMTHENFAEIIGKNDLVFIDFWAEWCGPCRMFGPIFEEAAGRHPGVVFAKVDTQAQPELAGEFSVRSIPTLAIMRQSVLLFQQPGLQPAEALDELVLQAQALDMDEVRRDIVARQAEAGSA